ncbi:hypothetical protein GCK32_007838 [Trichostrongylus colubriformis]|uniref:Uncharacterized protein n=1 Tax=Trichostrongylus colubriformis TaxID=6319 RepID=A0AAN8FGX2_TRICO
MYCRLVFQMQLICVVIPILIQRMDLLSVQLLFPIRSAYLQEECIMRELDIGKLAYCHSQLYKNQSLLFKNPSALIVNLFSNLPLHGILKLMCNCFFGLICMM